MSLTPEEALTILERPVTIYAPEGTIFRLQRFINREATAEQISNPTDLMHRLELRGPGDDNDHLWLATWDGEIVDLPNNADVPASWTELARIALMAYLDWDNWSGMNIGA